MHITAIVIMKQNNASPSWMLVSLNQLLGIFLDEAVIARALPRMMATEICW